MQPPSPIPPAPSTATASADPHVCVTHRVRQPLAQVGSVALDVLVLDAAIKALLLASPLFTQGLGQRHPLPLVPQGLLQLLPLHNHGMAFSALHSLPLWGVLALSALPLAGLGWWLAKPTTLKPTAHWLQTGGLGLVLGGGLNNWLDRALNGAVTDYLWLPWLPTFPVFNVADVAISLGAACLLLHTLTPAFNATETAAL